jgi:hypothetical protein
VSVVFLVIVLAGVVYGGFRLARAYVNRPKTRVIGPDDDPEFLWHLDQDGKNPRS